MIEGVGSFWIFAAKGIYGWFRRQCVRMVWFAEHDVDMVGLVVILPYHKYNSAKKQKT